MVCQCTKYNGLPSKACATKEEDSNEEEKPATNTGKDQPPRMSADDIINLITNSEDDMKDQILQKVYIKGTVTRS